MKYCHHLIDLASCSYNFEYELHTHAPKSSNRNYAFIGYDVFNWIFFKYMNKNRSRKFMTAKPCNYFIFSISGITNRKKCNFL